MHPDPAWEFEAGYDPVLRVCDAEGRGHAVGERPGVLRIESEGDSALHFDPAGRIISVHRDGIGYRRTLDHRLLVKRILRREGRRQGWQRLEAPEDPLGFLEEGHRVALRLLEAIGTDEPPRMVRGSLEDPAAWLRERLAAPASWTRERLEADLAELRGLYLPIPILPPDHYASLVLQITQGCAWNRCGFCDFYRGVPYREREPDEFLAHLEGVLHNLGGTLTRLRRVFLGQANALLVENTKLLPLLETIARRVPVLPSGLSAAQRRRFRDEHPVWVDGFHSFIDGFHRQKSASEYAALAEVGVRRVYLGLESGSPEVLRLLDKPPTVEAAIELVHALRGAGIRVGVIALVGAGGKPNANRHQDGTLDAIRRMELGPGDQVYLSRLVVHEGGPYEERARAEGLEAMDRAEQDAQIEVLRAGIREGTPVPIPVAPYEIQLSRSLLPQRIG